MKIAIVGAGVAGSFLAHMIKENNHCIEVYESSRKEDHWPVCAWAIPLRMLSEFSKKANLNFSDYIIHQGKQAKVIGTDGRMQLVNTSGLITYDKHRWELELLRGIDVHYGTRCSSDTFPFHKYDYVIDCTGVHRELLPKPNEDLLIPSYEYLVEGARGIDDFFIIHYKNAKGYFWYFPLDNGRAFVGAGDFDKEYYGIKEFFRKHPEVKIIKKIGRPIRLSPPSHMLPFFHKNVIGVGESIGCVFPVTGEGIAPSLVCCNIFLNSLNDNSFDYNQYLDNILKRFSYFDDAYSIVKLIRNNKLKGVERYTDKLQTVLINSPNAAGRIRKISIIAQLSSIINTVSSRLKYPIYNQYDLREKIINSGFNDDVQILDYLKESIPINYFPISNIQDVTKTIYQIFSNICEGQ